MRNMRGALWALGLAGATYAWRNRGRLQQQLNQYRQQAQPRQLPDNSAGSERGFSERDNSWEQPRESGFGGTSV